MKKITFILFALVSGTAFAQSTKSTGTADVKAEIVNPITITASGTLDFGMIAANTSSSGTVTVSPDGIRTIPEGFEVPGFTTVAVPTFTVNKEEELTYKVITGATSLTVEGEEGNAIPMTVTTSLGSGTGINVASFTVGGSIDIAAGQTAGAYEGEVTVTVSYE